MRNYAASVVKYQKKKCVLHGSINIVFREHLIIVFNVEIKQWQIEKRMSERNTLVQYE